MENKKLDEFNDYIKYRKIAVIGLGVSNPFVIKSKDLKGRDPEQSTLGSGAIPPQSTYSFSLNVSF